MRLASVLVLLVAALALAGCGGNGDEEAVEEEPAATETAPAETEMEEEAGDEVSGEQVFASAGCGGCHVLEEAGSTGTIGPELDGRNLSVDAVEQQVREGGGGMPAFEGKLSDEEIQAVSEFVAEASQG